MSISLAFTLLFAAAQADPVESARIAYSNCLVDVVNEQLDKDNSRKAFDTAAKAACLAEKTAYNNAIVSAELGMGSNQGDAKEFAAEEVASILMSWGDNYKDLKDQKLRPTKE